MRFGWNFRIHLTPQAGGVLRVLASQLSRTDRRLADHYLGIRNLFGCLTAKSRGVLLTARRWALGGQNISLTDGAPELGDL